MQEEMALSARLFSCKPKKKTLATQGFSDMEHSGIEPLTSTLSVIIYYEIKRQVFRKSIVSTKVTRLFISLGTVSRNSMVLLSPIYLQRNDQ
ncbi:hypothetical protein AAEY33_25135 [Peribacillus simplex]|uniref:hypothetical protein n=1 Tax=Peribacillus simplex TaxID=1478 RepID=UPI003267DA3F